MHEMSLCEGIVRIAEEQAKAQDFTKVRTITLEIGQLSAIDADALNFAFPSVARGTVADGALLEIVPIAGQAWCMMCEETVELPERGEPCPKCGGYKMAVTGGDAMRIKDMEVE